MHDESLLYMTNLETCYTVMIEPESGIFLWDRTIRILNAIFPDQLDHFVLNSNRNTPTICAFDMLPVNGGFRDRLRGVLEKNGYLFLSDFLNAGGDDDIAVITSKFTDASRAVEVEFTKVRNGLGDGSVAFRLLKGDEDRIVMSLVFRSASPGIPSLTGRIMREVGQTALPTAFPIVELLEEFASLKKLFTDR